MLNTAISAFGTLFSPATRGRTINSPTRDTRILFREAPRAAAISGLSARPLMFAFWGRRGALSQFSLDLAHAAVGRNDMRCTVSISRQNEQFDQFGFLHNDLHVVDTFERSYQVFLRYRNLQRLRSRLVERFERDGTQAIVSLMPHLWSPVVAPAIHQAGVRHLVIVHEADPHPGDRYALLNGWLLREATLADHVVALSESVANRLVAAHGIPEGKISVLFHPDMSYGDGPRPATDHAGPLRVLFLGRILPYKGLQVFADAMARLQREGIPVKAGVFGEGQIDPATAATLSSVGAEVDNRWIRPDEFSGILARYDVVAASHIQASQSGVVAAALGAGMPVVATPVGGLVEQIADGVTGILADAPTASAFANAVRRVARNHGLLARLRRGVVARREERSMARFLERISEIALYGRPSRALQVSQPFDSTSPLRLIGR